VLGSRRHATLGRLDHFVELELDVVCLFSFESPIRIEDRDVNINPIAPFYP
jgi:hypothetical protein